MEEPAHVGSFILTYRKFRHNVGKNAKNSLKCRKRHFFVIGNTQNRGKIENGISSTCIGGIMAENFLKEIYREAVLRTELKFLIEQFAGGSDGKERDNFQQVIKELETVSVKYAAMNPKDGGELLNALRKIQEYDGKYLEMADYLESDILPLYENYLRQLHKICVEEIGRASCRERV